VYSLLIKNVTIFNEGHRFAGDVAVSSGRIARLGGTVDGPAREEVDGTGLWLLPGVIDDQVHFREPGLTHKGSIASESKAAVAGGVTSFMEMPNTRPPALTQQLLEEKYALAAKNSYANYSFYMGASNDNLDEVLRTDPERVCGIKVFMGSSTGNMLVDDEKTLENLFSRCGMLIATHCEDEATIRANLEEARKHYGNNIPPEMHPHIRTEEACWLSSSKAVALARKHGTRLHILHLSTARELELFDNATPLAEKRITAEVCVHHLWFNSALYPVLGNRMKCNPAIKEREDQEALQQALKDGLLDVVATDHAPHTAEEKARPYPEAPSGLPLVQHSLLMMLELASIGKFSPEFVVEKMCHAPAVCFRVKERGYLREGCRADMVLVDPEGRTQVTTDSLHYYCGWSPLEHSEFRHRVLRTWVNGQTAYAWQDGKETFRQGQGERLGFN